MFERKSYTWDILEKKSHVLGYVFDLKLYQGYPRISLLKQDQIRDNPGSFFAAPGGLPAAAGLHSSLGPGTGDLLASVLGLRHGKPPETLRVAPSLGQTATAARSPRKRCFPSGQVWLHWQPHAGKRWL